ncbi:hypothetical protein ACFLX3_04170 [Chloroflexota bacterium]
MNYRLRKAIAYLGFILMLIISLVAVGCGSYNKEPFGDLVIENQTDQALIITVNDWKMGKVKAGD